MKHSVPATQEADPEVATHTARLSRIDGHAHNETGELGGRVAAPVAGGATVRRGSET